MIHINSCAKCINYLTQQKCLAFPDAIPEPIWTGKNEHKKPYDGDHGVQFEQKDGANDDRAGRTP